jgi:hypothetical protein
MKQHGFLVPNPGFSVLAAQRIRKAEAIAGLTKVGIFLDGVLAEPRVGKDIGPPIPAGIAGLLKLKGCDLYLEVGTRSEGDVDAWLERYAPSLAWHQSTERLGNRLIGMRSFETPPINWSAKPQNCEASAMRCLLRVNGRTKRSF